MIKCAQCGFDNSLGRLYCVKCKTKLNLGQITGEFFLNFGKHGGYRRKILQYMLLAIVVCFALALWPIQIDPLKISGSDLGKVRSKLIPLQKGVAVAPVEFSEKEVNILFHYLIQANRRQANFKTGAFSIHAGRVIISSKILTIYLSYQAGPWMLGAFKIGPFQFTYKVTGRPEKGPDGLRFTALNGAIGHLPLPALGRNLGMTRLQLIFLPYKNARVFLGGLEIVAMKKGSITVFGAE